MTTKHTPGPWHWTPPGHGDSRSSVCAVKRSNGLTIAAVLSNAQNDDARLIATAPELFAACETALARIMVLERQFTNGTDWCTSQLRQAIVKATGAA